MRPGANGTCTSTPASWAAFSTAAEPARTIRSASETFLPPLAEPLNSLWIPSSLRQYAGELGRLVDLPVLLWAQPNAGAVGATALVGAPEGRGRRPRGTRRAAARTERPDDRIFAFRAAMSASSITIGMIDCRDRVLPDQRFLRHQRAEIAGARAHVAVRELEPGRARRRRRIRPGARRSAARSSRRRDRSAATDRSSAWSAGVSSTHRRDRECTARCPSPATDGRRPGSWSVPTRT